MERSVNVTKHSTIPYVRYSFPLCNSNLSLRRAVIAIFDFKKCSDLEMGVKGHSRSLSVVSFDRMCMVTLSLKCIIIEIFEFKNAVTLKTGLGSVKVIGNVTMQ